MNTRLDYVNALRGLAILGVILVHSAQHGINRYPYYASSVIENGARGVQLFFVASAFTLFTSLDRRKETNATFNFFVRRIFRIAPMFYIGLIFYYWQKTTLQGLHFSTIDILSNLFFFNGFHPYWINSLVPGGWSIAVEMMFYCIVPFLFKRIKSLNDAIIAFVISCLICFISQTILRRIMPDNNIGRDFIFYFLPAQLPVFIYGIMAYFIIIKRDEYISKKNLILLSCLLMAQLLWSVFQPPVTYGAAFLILFVGMSQYKLSVIDNKIVRYIGVVSFSAYLVHFTVLFWMEKLKFIDFLPANNAAMALANFVVRYLVVVAITISISALFYNLVERPMQKVGKRLIDSLSKEKVPLAKRRDRLPV